MSSKKADIRIQFKDVPGDIFKCMYQGQIELSQISSVCNDTKICVVLNDLKQVKSKGGTSLLYACNLQRPCT